MKKWIVLMSLFAFNALAGNTRLTVIFDNYDIQKLKKASVNYESSSPLCKSVKWSLNGPITVNRKKSYPLSIDKVNSNTVYIEAPSVDPKNDGCQYRFSYISLATSEIYWLGLSSTRSVDYDPSDAGINVTQFPRNRITAECRGTQCQKRSNGSPVGYPSNAMVIYADKEALDSNMNVKAMIRVKFYD